MCGIFGYVSVDDQVRPEILHRMGATLRHRGPDDQGEWINHTESVSIGLGHNRLSIIDLSPAGHQPMCNEDGTIWLTCNGEIYNYHELRSELIAKGHTFKSGSDSETIVHLYEEAGVGCLERLRGMFAFALWDENRQSLFIARDRIGKKPMHYAVYDKGIAFASEIKALLRHPKIAREIDFSALNKYLTFEYVPTPHTLFRSIKKLKPGHYFLYQNGNIEIKKYWDIPLEDYPTGFQTEAEYIEELRDILERAVRLRLISDVPVGLFLSGGIDSGLMAALASRNNRDIECFSIGFEEKSFDESRYAKAVADALHLNLRLTTFSTHEMLNNLDQLKNCLDEPLADASLLPSFLLARVASKSLKVVISGDGGDELFAGYPTYQAHHLLTYYNSLPETLKTAIKRLAAWLPVSHDNISTDFKLKQFLRGAGVSSEVRFFLWMGSFTEGEKKELLTNDLRVTLRHDDTYEEVFGYLHESGLHKDLERLLYLSMKLYLQDDILVKVDRASMANGLEVRCPLLDQEFVEFVCRLPMQYKLHGLKTKYLLKKAAAGLLPEHIINRKKKGFGIPISKWLSDELRGQMLDYLAEERIRRQGFFKYPYVKKLINDHLEKRNDNRKLLWTLFVFQLWYEKFFENPQFI